jgi:hypothetical protein
LHGGQGAVAFDQGVQRIGVQRQLLARAAGVFLQGRTFGVAHGEGGGNGCASKYQDDGKRQAQGA